MRSRYLSTDYFFGSCSGDALRGVTFLSLSPPSLPTPQHQCDGRWWFSGRLDHCVDFPEAPAIDALPIDGALSCFLTEVVPKFYFAGEWDSSDIGSSSDRARLDSPEADQIADLEELDVPPYKCDNIQEQEGAEMEIVETMKNDRLINGRRRREPHEILQFEIIETGFFQRGCMSAFETDEGITLRIQGFGISLDILPTELENSMPFLHDVAGPIFLVENIPTRSSVAEVGFYSAGDSGSNGSIEHSLSIPEFEVIETLKLNECVLSDVLSPLFPNMKSWSEGQKEDVKESLELIDFDVLECSLVYLLSEELPEFEAISLDYIIGVDLLNLNGNNFLIRDSTIFPIASCGSSLQSPWSIYLLEIQILDLPINHGLEMFNIAEFVDEQEMPSQNIIDDFESIQSLYESIISCELCLVDDTFQSLPVPVLHEDKKLTIPNMLVAEILSAMIPYQESASDGIYLDWHFILEDTCKCEICCDRIDTLMKIQRHHIAMDSQFLGETPVALGFCFLEDPQEILDIPQHKESPKGLALDPLENNASPHTCQKDLGKCEQQLQKESTEKAFLLFESMSQSNDLNFFMNIRRGVASKNVEAVSKGKYIQEFMSPDTSSYETASAPSLPPWNIEEHQVTVADNILDIVDSIQKLYLAILTNETDLRQNKHLFPVVNDLELLKFPKIKLMELIARSSTEDEAFLPFVALYVIKQLAFFLCYFGIHTAHIYIWKMSETNEYLKARLSTIQCLIEDARKEAEEGLLESHPVLLIIEDVIRRKLSHSGGKILIVADRLFWLPLNMKLASMKINLHEVGDSDKLMVYTDSLRCSYKKSRVGALPDLDCFLVSHKNISEKFPFNEFHSILEYGGPRISSTVCCVSSKLVPLPHVHFSKVKLADCGGLKALCEGSESPESECIMDVKNKGVIEVINFMPTKDASHIESLESANKEETMNDTESASSRPYPGPDTIIIVNTQNSGKEMLICRRSSYQKILSTEKVGVQVVERDIDLPLDIILSAAVCLVWYDLSNAHIASAATDETSYAAKFTEILSTNILMSLSFAFSGCILVFEGESAFLSSIMEYSDALYAAATSLGLQLQLFCSYLPESTDEIVLGCIENNGKLHKGLYLAMPESQTLAECFLAKFPSINTLSAHAILSSGCKLGEFLQETPEKRIQTIWKYHIPDESMTLFNILCKYGQLWESNSGTTDCSFIESDVSSGDGQLQPKRQKCKDSPKIEKINFSVDDLLHIDQQSKPDSEILESSKESKLFQTRNMYGVEKMFSISDHKRLNGKTTSHDIWGLIPSENFENSRSERTDVDLNGEVVNWNFNFQDEGCQSVGSFPRMTSLRHQQISENSQLDDRHRCDGFSMAFPSLEVSSYDDIWTNLKKSNEMEEKVIHAQNDADSRVDMLPHKRCRGFMGESCVHDNTKGILGSMAQPKSDPLSGRKKLLNASQLSKLQGGSTQTIDFLNRIKEKNKMYQQLRESHPHGACYKEPRISREKVMHAPSQSPSSIDRYRYQGTSKVNKIYRQKKQVGRPPCTSNNGRKASSAVAPTWTPTDKRARLNLSFARNGHERQSKLVWTSRSLPVADCNRGKRPLDES